MPAHPCHSLKYVCIIKCCRKMRSVKEFTHKLGLDRVGSVKIRMSHMGIHISFLGEKRI